MIRALIGWMLLAAAPAVGIPVGYELLMIHVESRTLEGINGVCTAACSAVATSDFAEIGGLPLPVIGMAWFGGLALLGVIVLVGRIRRRRGESAARVVEIASTETPAPTPTPDSPAPADAPMLSGMLLEFLYIAGVLASLALFGISLLAVGELCPRCSIIHGCNVAGLVGAWLVMRRGPLDATGTVLRRLDRVGTHPATLATLLAMAGVGVAAEVRHRQLDQQIDGSDYLLARLIGTTTNRDLSRRGAPALGPENAPVKIVAFIEFTCPYCLDLTARLIDLQPEFGPQLRVEFRNYVNPAMIAARREGAEYAALAGICANRATAGGDGFWRFVEQIQRHRHAVTGREAIAPLLQAAGLDAEAIDACTRNTGTRQAFATDRELGRELNMRYLPVFFINGTWQIGLKTEDELRAMVRAELARGSR